MFLKNNFLGYIFKLFKISNLIFGIFILTIMGTTKLSNSWGKAKKRGETKNFEIWWGIKKRGEKF